MAFEEDVEYRKALPRDYLGYMGVAFSDDVSVAEIFQICPLHWQRFNRSTEVKIPDENKVTCTVFSSAA